MKVLVPVKRVLDYNIKPRPRQDGLGVELSGLKMSMNPFDEIATEAAVRLKESGAVQEVIAVTCGPASSQETLRTAMALGADRSLHIETLDGTEPLNVARLLAAVVRRESIQLVICGKQAIDDDSGQTGQMLAALLDWPQATFASAIGLDQQGGVQVTREIDGGLETLKLRLPAVITVDLRLNEPRFATLPNIMKAKKKPLDLLTPEQLHVEIQPHLQCLQVFEPPARKPGILVKDASELVQRLRNEAKVI